MNKSLTRLMHEANFKPVGRQMEDFLYEQFNRPLTARLLKRTGKIFFRNKFEFFFVNQEDQLCTLDEWMRDATEFFAEYQAQPAELSVASSMMSVAVSSMERALLLDYDRCVSNTGELVSQRWDQHMSLVDCLDEFDRMHIEHMTSEVNNA